MKNYFELTTERVRLVMPQPEQAQAILQFYIKNKEHFAPTDPKIPESFYTLGYWQNKLTKNIENYEDDKEVRFFLEPIDDAKKCIGNLGFSQIARGPFQACYLGYSLDKDYEGKGIMYDALQKAIQFMFEQRNIHRIMANHLLTNQRSANLLKRLNFVQEGLAKDYLLINGRWQDHVLNSLTNLDWSAPDQGR